jgi:hypothetical protein
VVRGDGHVLPRDFVAEVDGELDDARRHLERDRHRVVALEELRRIATAVAADLVRPVTVADVIRSARDPGEREHDRLDAIAEVELLQDARDAAIGANLILLVLDSMRDRTAREAATVAPARVSGESTSLCLATRRTSVGR